MAVANAEQLCARSAAFILVLVEEQGDATLNIGGLPLPSSDGHAERSSEEAMEIVGGIGVFGDWQAAVWTSQPLDHSLVPFDHHALDSISSEKSKDVRGSLVCDLCGGGGGVNRYPNHHGTESGLPVLA